MKRIIGRRRESRDLYILETVVPKSIACPGVCLFVCFVLFFCFFVFFITVDVRASLRVPRLIPLGPGAKSRVNTLVLSRGLEPVTFGYPTQCLF